MISKPIVLICGAQGQVGNEFRFLAFSQPNFQFIFADRSILDITNAKKVNALFEKHPPQYVVNCAAYTAVDKAETDTRKAARINITGARNLAKACAKTDSVLIHLSTDYVYHNTQNTPFKEDDRVSPKGVYAKTKLRGERAALQENPLTMIVRTSWVYGAFGHNFVKTMLRLAADRPELGVVFDQIGTPTYARDIAKTILQIINKVENGEKNRDILRGVFNFSNEGITSWYDFAKAIFEIRNLPTKVRPIESSQFPTPAQRPPFSAMNKGKIKETFGIEIPHWRDSLIAYLNEV